MERSALGELLIQLGSAIANSQDEPLDQSVDDILSNVEILRDDDDLYAGHPGRELIRAMDMIGFKDADYKAVTRVLSVARGIPSLFPLERLDILTTALSKRPPDDDAEGYRQRLVLALDSTLSFVFLMLTRDDSLQWVYDLRSQIRQALREGSSWRLRLLAYREESQDTPVGTHEQMERRLLASFRRFGFSPEEYKLISDLVLEQYPSSREYVLVPLRPRYATQIRQIRELFEAVSNLDLSWTETQGLIHFLRRVGSASLRRVEGLLVFQSQNLEHDISCPIKIGSSYDDLIEPEQGPLSPSE